MRLTGARATRWSVSSSSCARARSNACSTLLENRETVAMPCEPYLLNVKDHRIAWEWQVLIIVSAISDERALRHLIQAQGAVAPGRRAIALRVNAGNRKAGVDETMTRAAKWLSYAGMTPSCFSSPSVSQTVCSAIIFPPAH
jgi:hypothetical protein